MELELSGAVLKSFRGALQCLARLGEDLDFTCAPDRLSVSVVNSSRTAFGIVHFYPRFFQRYHLDLPGEADDERSSSSPASPANAKFRFSVTAKALLSTLRPRSAHTVESCTIAVHDSDDPRTHHEPGVDSGECRIVVYLHCQHGIRKKHSLTYSNPSVQSWARFDLNQAPNHWTASSRVLKDWMAHFHERSGSGSGSGGGGAGGGGGTDEITFYCSRAECRLKSFNDVDRGAPSSHDLLATRSLSTEVTVDTDDFDAYHVPTRQVITFALKDFKAIINFAEPLQTTLTARFSRGGRPILFSLDGSGSEPFQAVFVIATTDFDSGGAAGDGSGQEREEPGAVKREGSENLARHFGRGGMDTSAGASGDGVRGERGPSAAAEATTTTASTSRAGRPLFNAPTPSPAPPAPRVDAHSSKNKGKARVAADQDDDDDEDEYGAAFGDEADLDEAFFADLDRATQQHYSQSQSQAPTQGEIRFRSGVGGGDAAEVFGSVAAAGVGVGAAAGGSRGSTGAEEGEAAGGEEEEDLYGDGGDGGGDEMVWDGEGPDDEPQLGPTQRALDDSDGEGGEGRSVKRARWNLLGDG